MVTKISLQKIWLVKLPKFAVVLVLSCVVAIVVTILASL